jgi:hypothetical protein
MPCLALPRHAKPRHARLCHALPFHVSYKMTMQVKTLPRHAKPRHARPCQSPPRPTVPIPTKPSLEYENENNKKINIFRYCALLFLKL